MATLDDVIAQLQKNNDTSVSVDDKLARIIEQDKESAKVQRRGKLTAVEAAREAGKRGGGVVSGVLNAPGNLLSGVGNLAGGIGGGLGGALSGLGSLGMAAGALTGGLGILFAGGGYLLSQLQSFDGEAVKDNVLSLLSIGDGYSSNWSFFIGDAAPFAGAMMGIGAGLAAFALGQGAVTAVQMFEQPGWTEKVKENVLNLLSISDSLALGSLELLYKGGTFGLAMSGIGAGLAVFGVGSAIAGLSTALTNFIAPDWAQNIKDSVLTLLSISEELGGAGVFVGESATFLIAMGGLGLGLAAFGAGAILASGADMISDWFSDGSDWAQNVKTNVMTLFSIKDDLGGTEAAFGATGTFLAVMGGLGLGLAAFAVGGGFATMADVISDWGSESGNWTQDVKDNVLNLLSIGDELGGYSATFADTGTFLATMTGIALGLGVFSGAGFVTAIVDAGSKLMRFLTGTESPIDQIRDIARNADELEKGASALERIAGALETFGNINLSGVKDLDFTTLSRNLGQAIPYIDVLANGGTYDPWGLGNKIDIPEGGILNPSLRLPEMAEAIRRVNYVLGIESTAPVANDITPIPIARPSTIIPDTLQNLYVENLILRNSGQQPIVVQNNNQTNHSTSTGGGGGGRTSAPAAIDSALVTRDRLVGAR